MMNDHPSTEVDWLLNKIEPLKRGYAVTLSMDDGKYSRLAKYRGTKKNQLVALAPGELYGFASRSVLVSIVGNGCCVVHPTRERKVADLVLAGMPAKLANLLMEKLHRLYQEN